MSPKGWQWLYLRNASTNQNLIFYIPQISNHRAIFTCCKGVSIPCGNWPRFFVRSRGWTRHHARVGSPVPPRAARSRADSGHNGHKPKRTKPKGHKPKRTQTVTATDRNGHKPKRTQTGTATNRNRHIYIYIWFSGIQICVFNRSFKLVSRSRQK